ncbi:MAG: hypothetical protein R2705_22425 [Ilumatobacteraceae bacterium]
MRAGGDGPAGWHLASPDQLEQHEQGSGAIITMAVALMPPTVT